MTRKSVEERYQKLTDIEHVLLRPGRYLGSIKPHTALSWVYDENSNRMIKKEITWNPALLKMFDEIISNSVDESKHKGSKLDTIKVTIEKDTGKISVYDNGGIPVEIHRDHNQYIPEMIFGELRSGSNFDDSIDSTGTGQNGEGSSLTNIFSTKFIVETCDGKNRFKQTFSENLHKRTKPKIDEHNINHTKITYIPDYERLNCTLDDDNYDKLVKRVYDISGCNPELKIVLNNKRVQVKSFKDYVSLYTEDFIYDTQSDWNVAVASSSDGFQHISFVNTTETTIGGTHISYISDQITNKLRAFFNKKHKVDVKPSEIRNHMTLFVDATVINPRYSSQTKEDLITEPKEYKTEWKVDDKFINKIIKSQVIQDVLDWVEAKQAMAEKAALRALNKDMAKVNPRRITKFSDATEKKDRSKCILFLTEGDCLHEDTEILVYDSELPKKLKDVVPGDHVLTAKNRLKPIININKSTKKGLLFKINGDEIIMSEDHRMLVYDKKLDKFGYHKAKDINPARHQLVKSQLVKDIFILDINEINDIEDENYQIEISFGDLSQKCTANHTYFVYDLEAMEFLSIEAYKIIPGKHCMVMKRYE